jgi:hypothetical protein
MTVEQLPGRSRSTDGGPAGLGWVDTLWAYLRTIPAIKNHVPDSIPPAEAPPK